MKNFVLLFTALSVFFAFMPPAMAEKNDFTLCAGDVIQITVWKEEGLDRETLVLPDGSISFPLIGSMKVLGKSLAATQDMIKEKLQNLIPDASVTVVVKAPLGHTVSVLGQVAKPGELIINHRMTVMQALSQAGGLTPYASEGSIHILRHTPDDHEISLPYDYGDISSGHDLHKEITLVPGDVVVVPTAGLF